MMEVYIFSYLIVISLETGMLFQFSTLLFFLTYFLVSIIIGDIQEICIAIIIDMFFAGNQSSFGWRRSWLAEIEPHQKTNGE